MTMMLSELMRLAQEAFAAHGDLEVWDEDAIPVRSASVKRDDKGRLFFAIED